MQTGASSPAPPTPQRSVVFYTPKGWGGLLNAVTNNNNPANNYYFDAGAPPTDQTALRPDSVYTQIAGSGSNVHPMAEFNLAAWKKQPGTWFQKAVRFRDEMAAQGLGNATWAINEAGSGMRAKSDAARNHLVNVIKGLYQGSRGMSPDQGFVFQQGPGYSQGLQHFLGDKKFWSEIQGAVKAYMPETYVSPSKFEHESRQQRRNYLLKALVNPTLKGPMMSAYWGNNSAYGNTQVPLGNMERFVNSEARIASELPVEGFAWNEAPKDKSVAEVRVLAARLAAAAARR